MLKLYFLYLIVGGYVAARSLESWVWSAFNDCNPTISLIALIGSCILFFIVTGATLFSVNASPRIGLLCLASVLPFAIFWFGYYYKHSWPLTQTADSREVLAGAVLYIVAIFYTVTYVVKPPLKITDLSKQIKLALAGLPVGLLGSYILYVEIFR